MRQKLARTVSSEASAAILGWPNWLARELYTAAIQQPGKENLEITLDDVLAVWPIALQRVEARIRKQTRTKSHRGKTSDKAA